VKANLSWSRTRAKFCQLIASLYVFIHLSFLCWRSDLRTSSLNFVSLSWSKITDKRVINWQNFARVRLQLKFAFIMQTLSVPKVMNMHRLVCINHLYHVVFFPHGSYYADFKVYLKEVHLKKSEKWEVHLCFYMVNSVESLMRRVTFSIIRSLFEYDF